MPDSADTFAESDSAASASMLLLTIPEDVPVCHGLTRVVLRADSINRVERSSLKTSVI